MSKKYPSMPEKNIDRPNLRANAIRRLHRHFLQFLNCKKCEQHVNQTSNAEFSATNNNHPDRTPIVIILIFFGLFFFLLSFSFSFYFLFLPFFFSMSLFICILEFLKFFLKFDKFFVKIHDVIKFVFLFQN